MYEQKVEGKAGARTREQQEQSKGGVSGESALVLMMEFVRNECISQWQSDVSDRDSRGQKGLLVGMDDRREKGHVQCTLTANETMVSSGGGGDRSPNDCTIPSAAADAVGRSK